MGGGVDFKESFLFENTLRACGLGSRLQSQPGLVWDGIQEILLIITKFYHLRLFDVQEFEDDIFNEVKRMKNLRKKAPYTKDYMKKVKQPEQAIVYGKMLMYL